MEQHGRGMESRVQAEEVPGRKIPPAESQGRDADRIKSREAWETRAEKSRYIYHIPVPQTDTGRQGEDPEAGGGSIVKELGKTAP